MKRFAPTLALAVAALTLTSCGKLPPVQWPQLVECGKDAGLDLVGEVTQKLYQGGDDRSIGDRAKDALAELAGKYGAPVVACVIERLVHDWTAPGAAQAPERVAAAARGREFLYSVGTKAVLPDEGSGGE